MNIDIFASEDFNVKGGGMISPSTGLSSDTLPEVQKSVLAENSNTGVSTINVLSSTGSAINEPHWYALRTTYGRERKAYDYIISHGGTAFYPTYTTVKVIGGKLKRVEESRLSNIFFAYGTEDEIKAFVYDNVNLPFLRFYYHHCHLGNKVVKKPLVVPDRQMESLRIICKADASDIIVSTGEVTKFRTGQRVLIIGGKFKGVTGVVARYQGQQRVGIVIDGLLTVITAYIPTAFIKDIQCLTTIKQVSYE